jgi:large conductance mechanosensitive channel
MFQDFKKFALRGNVVDLAVGVIVGAAFGKIVTSLVTDIITPLIGILLNGIDITSLTMTIGRATVTYGNFLQSVADFLIISFVIFVMIQQVTRLRKKFGLAEEEDRPPAPQAKDCPHCYSKIHIKAIRCPACTSPISNSGSTPV